MPAAVAELCLRVEAGRLTPRYLTERDLAWAAALLTEYRAFEGERRSQLRERLREPLSVRAPYAKRSVLERVLDELARDRVSAVLPPVEARWLVFRAAAQFPGPRDEVLARVAASANVEPSALEAALFADLASERRVGALPRSLLAADCLRLANRALVAALLSRAVEVRVSGSGERAIAGFARHAQRLGLICSQEPIAWHAGSNGADGLDAPWLYVSGPLSLFRHTHVYGRALGVLVPELLRGGSFVLEAQCRFERADSGLPLWVCAADPLADDASPLEPDALLRRFLADFRALGDDWEIEASSATWSSGASLVCPEFELFEKARPARRVQLHLVRFWTKRSLESALAWAALHGSLVCVDAAGACDGADPISDSRALFYRTRPDARKLLSWLREQTP